MEQRNTYRATGRILSGVGGRYTILTDIQQDTPLVGQTVICRAKGAFRHDGITPLPGDRVLIGYSDASFSRAKDGTLTPDPDGTDIRIEQIAQRRCELIRPPMANLDLLLVTLAVAAPAPLLPMVDKLICACEHNGIEPVIIVGKSDLDADGAQRLTDIYRRAGFAAFCVSAQTGQGVDALRAYIHQSTAGRIAAFAGASGVGKSTLMNLLFPTLSQQTGNVSEKTARGRHTTRQVTIFPLPLEGTDDVCYIADTPGFSLLDFEQFDFMEKDDLPLAMREFRSYLGQCRYTDCTHTKEADCAIVQAVRRGEIAATRHESFLIMYHELKDKKPWNRPARKF